MLKTLIDDVKKFTKAVGLNTKGIEEFKVELKTIESVKTAVTSLSDDLK